MLWLRRSGREPGKHRRGWQTKICPSSRGASLHWHWQVPSPAVPKFGKAMPGCPRARSRADRSASTARKFRDGFVDLACAFAVVVSGDIKLFSLARSVLQLECLGQVLSLLLRLAQVAVDYAQRGVGHGKVRIEFDGPLQMRNSFLVFQLLVLGLAQGEGLQRLQRRCRRLLQRRGELLHRPDRLAQLLPQIGRRFIQRLQHLLLAFRLHLRPCPVNRRFARSLRSGRSRSGCPVLKSSRSALPSRPRERISRALHRWSGAHRESVP